MFKLPRLLLAVAALYFSCCAFIEYGSNETGRSPPAYLQPGIQIIKAVSGQHLKTGSEESVSESTGLKRIRLLSEIRAKVEQYKSDPRSIRLAEEAWLQN